MGVNGLWQVLQPCARPTNLATLNRKRLAVDASIWIYQFLKAVRDKEGNALRNSHVVGFFRRICKLLWFGIKPVFVFDGGAPALKRATLQGRRRRREGRREDAVRTAGKLLAVQMQRLAEEEDEKRKVRAADAAAHREDEREELPDVENMVYAEEAFASAPERQMNRKFFKQDQYHLPELDRGIDQMGKPEDPRIMSVEELEEYARQFSNGEDINLYDFSKIDFDGEFFKSLPPADRYNILNAARLRSRLRMGLSKEQLDDMFPNRMDFSRFQIERVQERNFLTQRLMFEMKMTGTDLTMGGGGRIAGEKNREYILVKNDSVEGGYALGVVSQQKDIGEAHRPIDVDALQFQYETKNDDDEWNDIDFEDVPIEGVNRLPKPKRIGAQAEVVAEAQDEDGMFVDEGEDLNGLYGRDPKQVDDLFESLRRENQIVDDDEQDDINRAIALSLQNQHGISDNQAGEPDDEEEFEDVAMPQWTQKAVDQAPKPIASTSGKMVAHIINNRANAAVVRRKENNPDSDSESDGNWQAALKSARRKKKPEVVPKPKAPVRPNVKNPFEGAPLPFEKMDWRSHIFEKKPTPKPKAVDEADMGGGFTIELSPDNTDKGAGGGGFQIGTQSDGEETMEGGFEKDPTDDAPKPLPPWMVNDDKDIRDSLKEQQQLENEINEQDQALAMEQERLQGRRRQNQVVEIGSSDDESDVEIIDAPPPPKPASPPPTIGETLGAEAATGPPNGDGPSVIDEDPPGESTVEEAIPWSPSPEPQFEDVELPQAESEDKAAEVDPEKRQDSEEPVFEDVEMPQVNMADDTVQFEPEATQKWNDPVVEDVAASMPPISQQQRVEGLAPFSDPVLDEDDEFADREYDEFSDPEDEELLASMAEEAEEHARFASQLNNKPAHQNQEDYEKELRALRNQQKKDRRDADEVTQIMVTECQALLKLFGIPYITAPMEAEAQCAELVHLGLVDGIVTDDSDTFLFGGTRVYKNMFNSNKFVECYISGDLDKELSLSREQLISIAHLLGSDYTEGIPGIGPVTAVEILSEFPGRHGLEEFKQWWQDVQSQARPKEADAGHTFRLKFRRAQAKKVFLSPAFPSPAVYDAYMEPSVDKDPEPFQWGVPDLEGLRRFLMATIGWSPERTDEVLVPVIKDMNRRGVEGTQSNITRYFEGSVGAGAKEAFAPRQRAKTSKRMSEAVSKLKAKQSAAADGGPVPDAGAAEPVDMGTRKRKARAAVVDNDEDDNDGNDDDDFVDDYNEAAAHRGGRKTARGKGKGKGKGKKAKV